MKPWGLWLSILFLAACRGEVATLPDKPADRQLDHFRLVVPAVIESGYDKFEISIIAENRACDILRDYRGDWPEAYPFLIVPGWKSFIPKVEGDITSHSWKQGTVTLICHFDRGVFCEEVCPVQGYWELSLEDNGPVATDNSYTPWIVVTQGRIYW